MPTMLKRIISSNPILSIGLIGILVFLIHLTTAAHYPACWFDEIEILEMGRFSIFDVNPEWSVNLFPSADAALHPPAPFFHYLTGALQELLYRATGSFLLARVLLLASLPATALLLFVWLKGKDIPAPAALAAATLFVLDPNATICAHWYRPDLWTMSCAFGAMILLAQTRNSSTRKRLAACFAAGVLTSVMLFLWITSMLLLPLICWEALVSARMRPWRDGTAFVTGFVLCTIVFLVPLFPHIPAILNQYAQASELGGGIRGLDGMSQRAVNIAKIALRSPFVWICALVGIVVGRRFAMHALMFFVLCGFMMSTNVYHLRMVQLMPFLFLFAATALVRLSSIRPPILRSTGKLLVYGAMLFSFTLSVLALNYAAWPGENTLNALVRKFKSVIPLQQPNVYLYDMEHELYYAGRSLGWKMFSFNDRELLFDRERSADLLAHLDAVVVSDNAKSKPSERDLALMRSKGLSAVHRIEMPPVAGNRIKTQLANLFYAHAYPSCTIYLKQPDTPK